MLEWALEQFPASNSNKNVPNSARKDNYKPVIRDWIVVNLASLLRVSPDVLFTLKWVISTLPTQNPAFWEKTRKLWQGWILVKTARVTVKKKGGSSQTVRQLGLGHCWCLQHSSLSWSLRVPHSSGWSVVHLCAGEVKGAVQSSRGELVPAGEQGWTGS